MKNNPLPYRSGATPPPLTFDQILWRLIVLEAYLRLELYHPRSTTRWN